ncbi:MAG: hypothetical protein RIC18_06870 [Hoeflea sp.]|uniref:hypothetical protein n=1 Tax=Hoeflea sp. TaxID=1940281 RepID=UPI0032F02A56
MNFLETDLATALSEGLNHDVERIKAQAQNIAWDESVSRPRQSFFETDHFGIRGPAWLDLARRQSDYVRLFVKTTEIPHSFLDHLKPAAFGEIDEAQHIVRIESLVRPMNEFGCSLEELSGAFDDKDGAFLDEFLLVWNGLRDRRSAFGTFLREVPDEVESDRWPLLLRDRFGLAHYPTTSAPEPVALMCYSVADVLKEAETSFAVTMPTVLDSDPWEHFFPAPKDLCYGRAMALTPCDGDETLVAEFLHSRVTYKHDHIRRIGQIDMPAPVHDIAQLREMHLLALQIASGREDFGV